MLVTCAILALIWISIFSLNYYLNRRHLVLLGSKLPGPKGYPIIGNLLDFYQRQKYLTQYFINIFKKWKRLVAFWIGPYLVVCIYNAKDVETILKSKDTTKSKEYKLLQPWLGDSILISEGCKFKRNKKMLVPAFHTNNLKKYVEIFNEHCKVLIEKIETKIGGEEFDVHPYLGLFTMFVLLETSMGVQKETLGQEALDYSNAVENIGKLVLTRGINFWLRPDFIFKYSNLKREQDNFVKIVHGLTERVIAQRKTEKEEKQWPIFLDKFMEEKNEEGIGMTDKELKDEVLTMLFAGQDTTTVSAGFALCLLGLYHDVQNKLLAEITEVFGDSKSVNFEDCKKLEYMEQVIQETWRLFPPIPFIGKTATEDIDLGDYKIPKNSSLLIMLILLHRDAEQYPDPFNFNPDNFHPDNIKLRHPASFIPFSSGLRSCIGQRYSMLLIKTMLVHILRNFQVFSTIPQKRYKLSFNITLKRTDGFMISVKRRN